MKENRRGGLLRLFLSYFKRHRGLFVLDICCALLVAAIDLAYPLVSRSAMYDLLPDKLYHTFFVVMAVVLLAYVLRTVLYYIITYWGHTFGVLVETDIRHDLYTHFQKMGFAYFDHNRTGQLMSRLTSDLFEITELAHHGPEDIIISTVTVIGALIVMFSIEWRLALVVALILPVFLIVVTCQRNSMNRVSADVKRRLAGINADIESGLSGIRTAKAFANETLEREKFDDSNVCYQSAKKDFYQAMARFQSSMEFFFCILSAAVIAVGGYLIMRDEMSYVDLITFSLYITSFVTPLRKLSNFSEMFAGGFAGLRRVSEILSQEPSVQDAPDAAVLHDVRGSIDLDHVSFSYEGNDEVLQDVNLHVQPGETVAVVGPSGGGKTTLCQLIPRFYDVTEGAVSVDGHDVRQVTQHSLHENIGIVQQDVFLFADSILENIRYGRLDATDAEVAEAAKKAEIYDDIMAMPDGFRTYVGERGALLSGGQKQRIAIARIFLKNPPVLILDEATSALDSVTESKIQHAFDALAEGRTTLIIAHRLSTIRSAARIIVVADGRIVEQGDHAALLAQGGLYARLYETQSRIAADGAEFK